MDIHIQPMTSAHYDWMAGVQIHERKPRTRLDLIQDVSDQRMHLVFLGEPGQDKTPDAHFLIAPIARDSVQRATGGEMCGIAVIQLSVHDNASLARVTKITRFIMGTFLLWYGPDGDPLLIRVYCKPNSPEHGIIKDMPGGILIEGPDVIYQFRV